MFLLSCEWYVNNQDQALVHTVRRYVDEWPPIKGYLSFIVVPKSTLDIIDITLCVEQTIHVSEPTVVFWYSVKGRYAVVESTLRHCGFALQSLAGRLFTSLTLIYIFSKI